MEPGMIGTIFEQRKRARSGLMAKMAEVRQAYHGDIVLPMPDLGKTEGSYVANLVQSGIDNIGSRVASTMPMIQTFPLDPTDKQSVRRAQTRRRALLAWWATNDLERRLIGRRARHLVAYGCSPVTVRAQKGAPGPVWEIRHPLETYPDAGFGPTDIEPKDVIFHRRVTTAWLKAKGFPVPDGIFDETTKLDLLEYIDDKETLLVVHSPSDRSSRLVRQTPHNLGACPVVIAQRVSLDIPMGQFNQITGMYALQAKLMALEVVAVEKGIFPDTYLISRPGETARYVAGPFDGRSGQVNVVEGGDPKELMSTPTYLATQIIDRLERSQRVTAGIPAEFGGESGSNIRTGRRGDAVLSAVIDMPIKECQDVLAASLEAENRRAAQVALVTYPDRPLVYLGAGGPTRSKPLTFTARQVFGEDQTNSVSYPFSGSDVMGQTSVIGQMVGIGLMSSDTARTLHPYVENPDLEKDLMQAEQLERTMMMSVQQAAQTGALPPEKMVDLWRYVREDRLDLMEAVERVVKETKAEQEKKMAEQQAQAIQPPPQAQGAAEQAMVNQPTPIRDMASLVTNLRKTGRPVMGTG